MMKTDYKLQGLGRKKSITLFNDKEDCFWPKVEMSQQAFDELWNYIDGKWGQERPIAEVEHDGFYYDSTPINPIVRHVRV